MTNRANLVLRSGDTLTIVANEHKLVSLYSDESLGISAQARSVKAAAALAAYAKAFGARVQVSGLVVDIYA